MGFRSTFISEGFCIELPQWFIDKYPSIKTNVDRDGRPVFAVAQLAESKFYEKLSEDERILDIQKAIKESDLSEIVLILLHECGGITRVQIGRDSIRCSEPTIWKKVEYVEHSYCYGCSDASLALPANPKSEWPT